MSINLTPEQRGLINLVIERAEQACRYALKHQDLMGKDQNYQSGWEVAAAVCEAAIRDHVMRHIADDLRDAARAEPERGA